MSATPPRRCDVLGVALTPMTPPDLPRIIDDAVSFNTREIIAHHNLHSVYVFHHDERMRRFYERATWIYVDGMPLVWAGRLRGHALERRHRMTTLDFLPAVLDEAERRHWRCYYVGSTPKAARTGERVLRARWPTLALEVADGYFDVNGPDNDERLARIKRFRPHVLFVGMGMPRQEHWILDNVDEIGANVIWTVGAYLDYVAGAIPTPPRWMGNLGLEWAYRLATEPQRLARRYLVEPWFMLTLMPRDLIRRIRNENG